MKVYLVLAGGPYIDDPTYVMHAWRNKADADGALAELRALEVPTGPWYEIEELTLR